MHRIFIYLEKSDKKNAHYWQLAYLHILFSEISVTWKAAITWLVMLYLLNMYHCTVPTLLSLVVQRSCLNVAGTGEEDMLRLHFAHFGPFWVKSQSLIRLPHSQVSACASRFFSVTLCLIFVVWPCIDDLYSLNVSVQKLARKLQFAYFHPVSVKSQSLKRLPHSQLSACASRLFCVTLCLHYCH